MHCFLPRQQLGCYSFPKSSSGINWAGGLLPGLGITHAMEPSRGRAAASQGLSAPQDASVRVWDRTLTCWGFAQGKAAKKFKRGGHCSVCKSEICGHEHFTALEIKHQALLSWAWGAQGGVVMGEYQTLSKHCDETVMKLILNQQGKPEGCVCFPHPTAHGCSQGIHGMAAGSTQGDVEARNSAAIPQTPCSPGR